MIPSGEFHYRLSALIRRRVLGSLLDLSFHHVCKPKREKPWIMQLSGYQQIFPDTEIYIPKPLSLKDCTIAQWMERWNNGEKKNPDWSNLWETLLRGNQSSSGDMLAGAQGCWVRFLEGLALGQPMWAGCLPLQLKGEQCLEKELWVTSRNDACGLA